MFLYIVKNGQGVIDFNQYFSLLKANKFYLICITGNRKLANLKYLGGIPNL